MIQGRGGAFCLIEAPLVHYVTHVYHKKLKGSPPKKILFEKKTALWLGTYDEAEGKGGGGG